MNCLYSLVKVFLCISAYICVSACTFDYGITESVESPYPDITMEDLDYVRVRKGTPIARMQAEIAERYEKRRRMELINYSFEQYNTTNEEIDAAGSGGFASVELDTSNIHMSNGVEIIVDTEDIRLDTERLDWDDGKKFLKGGENDEINVEQADGSKLNGTGFSADVRAREWFVSYNASGNYIHDEDEDEDDNENENEENEDDDGKDKNVSGEVEVSAENNDNGENGGIEASVNAQ